MKLFSEGKSYKLYEGDMNDMLEVLSPNSIDSIVTDPPYELNFMAKSWDSSGVAFQKSTWEKCLTVLKPGGYLLAFGGTRTYHRIACAIEDAGFEIRDTIMYLYGSGFPKSMNLGKAVEGKLTIGSGNVKDIKKLDGVTYNVSCGFNRTGKITGYRDKEYELTKTDVVYHTEEGQKWSGWGTALKPAYEPIIVARKPCEGACIDNVLKYGVGGINIDGCRIGDDEIVTNGARATTVRGDEREGAALGYNAPHDPINTTHTGRYPSNVILNYDDDTKEEVCGGMPYTKTGDLFPYQEKETTSEIYGFNNKPAFRNVTHTGDSGSAARYFYCAKASSKDRDEGCENLEDKHLAMSNQAQAELGRGNTEFNGGNFDSPMNAFNKVQVVKNNHPTVKPQTLMQYLVRLVTPKGGTVLDPFNGSGSTGKACMYENREQDSNYKYIGIELTSEYLPISDARIKFVVNKPKTFKLF